MHFPSAVSRPNPDELQRALKVMDLKAPPVDKGLRQVFDVLVSFSMQRNQSWHKLKQIRTELAQKQSGTESSIYDKEFRGFVEDRSDRAIKFAFLTEKDYRELEALLRRLVPKLSALVLILEKRNPRLLDQQFRYFGTRDSQTSQILAGNFQKTLTFLSAPPKSRFKSSSEFRGRRRHSSPEGELTLAFEHRGRIYLVLRNLAFFSSKTFEDTLLHEVLHIFIEEGYQRRDRRDPAYSHEDHFFDISTAQALANPDSYVEFFREATLD